MNSDDGLTQWHPPFLRLGKTLDECAAKYRGFCKKYCPSTEAEEKKLLGKSFVGGNADEGEAKKIVTRTDAFTLGGVGSV